MGVEKGPPDKDLFLQLLRRFGDVPFRGGKCVPSRAQTIYSLKRKLLSEEEGVASWEKDPKIERLGGQDGMVVGYCGGKYIGD